MKRRSVWPGGRTWVYEADITNDGINSGNHQYLVVPGAGNELEILYGHLGNLDSAGRTSNVIVRDDDAKQLGYLIPNNAVIANAVFVPFPTIDEINVSASGAGQSNRWMLSGTMDLLVLVASVAVSQDTRFAIVGRIRGGIPTVTLTSPTDAVEVVNKNQVF